MSQRNLVVCPSRKRPDKFEKMYKSFLNTSLMSDLVLCLDNDDPTLPQYLAIIERYTVMSKKTSITVVVDIDLRMTITQRLNNVGANVDGYSYISVTNDDFVYITGGWDVSLISEIKLHGKYGIAYGNDLLARVNLPTSWVVSIEIVKALGWLQLPGLIGLCGDCAWAHIGKKLGILYYRDDIIIKHEHVFAGDIIQDEIFKETNAKERYQHDNKVLGDWIVGKAKEDIEKVANLIYNI